MRFRIDCQPPSVNERDKGRKRDQRRDLKAAVQRVCRGSVDADGEYEIHLAFHGLYRKKDGTLRKRDHLNLVKPLVDAVSEALGIDDRSIVGGSHSKVHDSSEFVEIRLERVDLARSGVRGRHGIT